MYQVFVSNISRKDLDRIKGKDYQRIRSSIIMLAENPRPIGCLKLTDKEGYRIRIGKFRILYEISDRDKTVRIYRVRHRSRVYK